jgi:hypothetical protein
MHTAQRKWVVNNRKVRLPLCFLHQHAFTSTAARGNNRLAAGDDAAAHLQAEGPRHPKDEEGAAGSTDELEHLAKVCDDLQGRHRARGPACH